jgi:MOSC domain-containing protein YiiM
MATIYSIVYQPEDKKYDGRNHDFIREPLQQATLVSDHGIDGDAKAGRNRNRQLNVLSLEWLEGLKTFGYRTKPGEFGEQVIVQGLEVERLQPGDQLQIGESAMIEITKARTGCVRLEAAQGRSNEAFGGLVGMMAKVVVGGDIQVGDEVNRA